MIRYQPKVVVVACLLFLLILCLPLYGVPQAPSTQSTPLTDFQKEAIASIREITLQLILIAMGVFAVIGGFATTEDRRFTAILWIRLAFILLGISVVSGLLAYGRLIWDLSRDQFDPTGVAVLARVQWGCFGLGGVLLMIAVLSNIRRIEGTKADGQEGGKHK